MLKDSRFCAWYRPASLGMLAVLSLAGCAHRYRSALYLPCKASQITVSEEVYSAAEETWVASCKGHDYGCHASSEGNKVVYGCKAMRRPEKRATDAPDAGASDL